MVYKYNGILLIPGKKGNYNICDNMDEFEGHYAN